MTPVLTARGLVRSYGPTPALRGINLEVGAGELVAITGPSGCGKSTLLHCLAGILRPDAGEVTYRGDRIDGWSEGRRSRLRRTEFGVLFQFGQLVAELTAAENVALPLLLTGVGRRAARTAALTWLDRLDVGAVAASRPGELSAVSSSGWRWPGHWSPSRRCCSRTSRPDPSTPWAASRCWAISSGWSGLSAPPWCW
jgi:putative ABC transport system ATP-binding protein